MTRAITVTGGKGGVGKTNISINLSLCLSKLGSKVCIFDADLGLANINILLGLYPEFNLEDVILNGKSIQDIMIKDYQGIDIIPGSSGVEKIANLEQTKLNRFIHSFSELEGYDFFIFDTSAGISTSVISFCLAAPEVILVITPEPTSLTDAYALLKILCLNQFSGSIKIVINQCKNTQAAKHTYNRFKDVVQKYLSIEIAPLGIVVQDKKFPEAVRRQKPLVSLYPESSAAKCINVMASRLTANKSEDFKQMGITSFWTNFLQFAKSPLKFTDKKVFPEMPGDDLSKKPHTQDVTTSPLPSTSQIMPGTEKKEKGADFSVKNRANHPLLDKIVFSDNLPTLPHILLKLIETCSKEDATMVDIGKIAEKDPSLCTKILRLVNSSYYNLPKKVKSLNQALSLLGIDIVRNVAVSTSICQVFNGLEQDSAFNMKLFWWHSTLCALFSDLIAKKISYSLPDETFLAGLLHDIGKLVLLQNYPEKYHEIIKTSKDYSKLFIEEEKTFGITHCEAGARLVRHWQLPSFIGDAVLYHHEPLHRIVNALPLVKIIYVANSLCNDSFEENNLNFEIAQEVIGLKPDDIDEIMQQAEIQIKNISQFLDIDFEHLPPETETTPSESDLKIQNSLTYEVRDMSLILGTLQNLLQAHDTISILQVARDGLQIVFDIKDSLFFLYDKSQGILTAVNDNDTQDDVTDELTIPFQDTKSILVISLKQGKIINSFDQSSQSELTIIDEQLIGLTGKDGMFCFPMIVRNNKVGVMVLGVDKTRVSQVEDQTNLLSRFVSYAAFSLHAEGTRQSQAKLLISERLAASQAIAKKVAHEVNNPLSIIKNYLKILELKLSEQNILVDELKIINDEIDRVSLTIEDLSDLSKPPAQDIEDVDMNVLLKDIAALTEKSFSQSSINIRFNLDTELPVIISDKNSLKKVFINLLKNASEALKVGGNIYIATKKSSVENHIEITISDDGAGLPEIIKSRLFEPYTTTKGAGHAGLGLSIVYSIVKAIKGRIVCSTTEAGKGTTFKIDLPVSIKQ